MQEGSTSREMGAPAAVASPRRIAPFHRRAIARARRERGESVTVIARHLRVGRSTLYRALEVEDDDAAWQAAGGVPVTAQRVREP